MVTAKLKRGHFGLRLDDGFHSSAEAIPPGFAEKNQKRSFMPLEIMKNKRAITPDFGIHPPLEALYIESMLRHTSSAKRSINVVKDWMTLINREDHQALDLPKSELFEHLQNILHQAGCISRYFFPSRERPIYLARSCRLKQAFGVENESPLADRDLRNAIEHFDERLDNYLSQNQVGEFFLQDIGYVLPECETPFHILKGFYINPLVFILLGKEYEMAPIVNELLRLNESLEDCCQQGYRLPKPKKN